MSKPTLNLTGQRYLQLQHIIAHVKPKTITEVGVFEGNSALLMCATALDQSPDDEIVYYGFDLFEAYDPNTMAEATGGKKSTCSLAVVDARLQELSDKADGRLKFHLISGDSAETAYEHPEAMRSDLLFLDGDHSVEHISKDMAAFHDCKVKVCDDYYLAGVDKAKFGCNMFVDTSQDPYFQLPIIDKYGDKRIAMCVNPIKAYPWVRYCAILQLVEHTKAKTMIAHTQDVGASIFLNYCAQLYGVKFVTEEDIPTVDIAFIDGRSLTREDTELAYETFKDVPVVVFDGIFGSPRTNDATGNCAEVIDTNEIPCFFANSPDTHDGQPITLAITPPDALPANVSLVVKSKNCVPDEQIQSNITTNYPKLTRWVQPCEPHSGRCIFVSAGPSLSESLPQIRDFYEMGDYIVCVKHSHDALIEAGIIPWGCVLLDPRDHVQEFVDNPHPETVYFVASMVHPTTLDQLLQHNTKVIGYNAAVNAGEEALLKLQPNKKKLFMIPGGSTSATRGISVMHALGFRKFTLFAYDSCYKEKAKKQVKTPSGYDKFVDVEILGREFHTDLELIAQANDFEHLCQTVRLYKLNNWDIDLDIRGDGMIPHIYNKKYRDPVWKHTYEDILRGI